MTIVYIPSSSMKIVIAYALQCSRGVNVTMPVVKLLPDILPILATKIERRIIYEIIGL